MGGSACVPTPGAPKPEHADAGRYFWLSDCQVSLAEPEVTWFSRTITEVTASDGLQETAQIDVDFDPTFERLVFNHVRVIRGGEVREVDVLAGLSVLRRERDLERARYDGRLTAHFVIPDLRVGDIVDHARTTIGQPAMFGRHFSAEWGLEWGCWVAETRVRLLARPETAIRLKSWNNAPDVEERRLPDGVLERIWRTRQTPPAYNEADVPGWVRRIARVRVSTEIGWAEVADTFRGGYAPEPLPADLEAEMAALEAETADPAVRAVRLLRSVQDRLRYQAVSIGDGGFVPRPVARIWGFRAGDCKDASRLLAALMRRVGLDAAPALVNTVSGRALNDAPPALNVFDHCIVRLRLHDADYWLDPTSAPQGGRLEVLHQARFGWALPLVEGADLVFMGEEPVRDVWRADEVYELAAQPDLPTTLTVTTTFSAWRADSVRRSLTSEPGVLARNYVEYYGRFFGEAIEVAPMQVTDDLEANELITVERYSLARAWEKRPDSEDFEFGPIDDLFANHLSTGRTPGRRWPIHMGLPRRLSWTTTIVTPVPIRNIDAWNRTYEMPGVRAMSRHDKLDEDGFRLVLERSIAVERMVVPPEEAEQLFDLRDAALRTAGMTVTVAGRDGRFEAAASRRAAQTSVWQDIWRWIWVVFVALMLIRAVAHTMAMATPPS